MADSCLIAVCKCVLPKYMYDPIVSAIIGIREGG